MAMVGSGVGACGGVFSATTASSCHLAGGTVYPILLQYLFVNVGFAWGVRISATICLVLCASATAMVSSRIRPRKTTTETSWVDLRALRDPPFALLVVGSCFVSLGMYVIPYLRRSDRTAPSKPSQFLFLMTRCRHRPLHSLLLRRILRRRSGHPSKHGVLRPRGTQRGQRARADRTIALRRHVRTFRPARSLCVPRGAVHPPSVVHGALARATPRVCIAVRAVFRRVQRAHRALHRPDLGHQGDRSTNRPVVQHHLISVSLQSSPPIVTSYMI